MAERVDARDGRALAIYEEGDPNGAPIIVHHGSPDSGLLYRIGVAPVDGHLTLIAHRLREVYEWLLARL